MLSETHHQPSPQTCNAQSVVQALRNLPIRRVESHAKKTDMKNIYMKNNIHGTGIFYLIYQLKNQPVM